MDFHFLALASRGLHRLTNNSPAMYSSTLFRQPKRHQKKLDTESCPLVFTSTLSQVFPAIGGPVSVRLCSLLVMLHLPMKACTTCATTDTTSVSTETSPHPDDPHIISCTSSLAVHSSFKKPVDCRTCLHATFNTSMKTRPDPWPTLSTQEQSPKCT
jgi:hypothetical protein